MALPTVAVLTGTLDFLPKVTIPSIVPALSDPPEYMWWYNYLIKASLSQVMAVNTGLIVLDNIDEAGEWFLVKFAPPPNRPYTFIHDGPLPAVQSEAETTPPAFGSRYLHIIDGYERAVVVEQIKTFLNVVGATEVYAALMLTPSLVVAGYAYHE